MDDSESPAGLPPRSRSPKDYLDLAKSKSFSCSAFVPAAPATTTNVAEFCDHSIDAQMARAAALQALDPSAATLLWQQIEHEILAQAPLVPTSNARNVDFFAKRVGIPFQPAVGRPARPALDQVIVDVRITREATPSAGPAFRNVA